LLEGWSLLYEVIAEEPKMTALREDTGLIIYRPILEVEYQTAGDAIALGALNQIAARQDLPLR
jgi:hypothetical protein